MANEDTSYYLEKLLPMLERSIKLLTLGSHSVSLKLICAISDMIHNDHYLYQLGIKVPLPTLLISENINPYIMGTDEERFPEIHKVTKLSPKKKTLLHEQLLEYFLLQYWELATVRSGGKPEKFPGYIDRGSPIPRKDEAA